MDDTVTRCPLKPTAGRVVVRRLEGARVSRGGILLPDPARAKKNRKVHEGVVCAVGPGRRLDDGGFAGPPVRSDGLALEVGDRVVFTTEAGEVVEVTDGVKWSIINEGDILVVID